MPGDMSAGAVGRALLAQVVDEEKRQLQHDHRQRDEQELDGDRHAGRDRDKDGRHGVHRAASELQKE
ncbi:MAG: hypothetical protein ACO3DQ_06955 [Cephaloticoccus sp.]